MGFSRVRILVKRARKHEVSEWLRINFAAKLPFACALSSKIRPTLSSKTQLMCEWCSARAAIFTFCFTFHSLLCLSRRFTLPAPFFAPLSAPVRRFASHPLFSVGRFLDDFCSPPSAFCFARSLLFASLSALRSPRQCAICVA
jgi:hypothetical protein